MRNGHAKFLECHAVWQEILAANVGVNSEEIHAHHAKCKSGSLLGSHDRQILIRDWLSQPEAMHWQHVKRDMSGTALSPDVAHVTVAHLGYRTLDLLHCSNMGRNTSGTELKRRVGNVSSDRSIPPRRVASLSKGKLACADCLSCLRWPSAVARS